MTSLQGQLEAIEKNHSQKDPHAQAYRDLTDQEPLVMLQFMRPNQPITRIQTSTRSVEQGGLASVSTGPPNSQEAARDPAGLRVTHCATEPSELSSVEGSSCIQPERYDISGKGTPESCIQQEPQWRGNPEFSQSPQPEGVPCSVTLRIRHI
jgi:hypothetical protein